MIRLDRKEVMFRSFKNMFWMSSSFQKKGREDFKKYFKVFKMS